MAEPFRLMASWLASSSSCDQRAPPCAAVLAGPEMLTRKSAEPPRSPPPLLPALPALCWALGRSPGKLSWLSPGPGQGAGKGFLPSPLPAACPQCSWLAAPQPFRLSLWIPLSLISPWSPAGILAGACVFVVLQAISSRISLS